MTDTNEDKRDELRAKIEASERRIEERTLADQAKEAAEAAAEYTKQNPLKVVGGAVAVGLVIGLMTQPGRRYAVRAATGTATAATGAARAVGSTAKSQSSRLGTLVGDALVAYGTKIIDEALDVKRAGQDALEDFGDNAAVTARKLRREANYVAGNAADKGRAATQRGSRRAKRAVRGMKKRIAG